MGTSTVRALAVTATFAMSAWAAQSSAQPRGPSDLSGTWLIEVTLRDCVSGTALEVFPTLNAFVATGTVLEYGTTAMVTPAKRSPGFGAWQRLDARRFQSAFSFFALPDGVNVGSLNRVERVITMTDPDHFTAEAKVKVFDPTGEVLLANGCGTETARRID